MANLIGDENFEVGVLRVLTALGHDVVSVASLDLANLRTPDRTILAYARELGRITLTHDRTDFVRCTKRRGTIGELSPAPSSSARFDLYRESTRSSVRSMIGLVSA